MQDRFAFWHRWLLVISIGVIVFGLGMALLCGTSLFDLFDDQVNPVFWDSKTVSPVIEDFQQWVYGVLGATMAGWGVFIYYVVRYPFKMQERWAWMALVSGLALWYVVDTSISALSGVYFNVLFNTILIVLLVPPLWSTRKTFLK